MIKEATIDLWKAYCHIRKVLSQKLNTNNITGDFAEILMADYYGGTLAPPSTKAYDFTANDKNYQVKSRMEKDGKVTGNLSDIHSLDFDYLITVFYNNEGGIELVKEFTKAEIQAMVYKQTSRSVISASAVYTPQNGKDITAAVKATFGI